MGLQLIFVVETDRKCQSDWKYLKETIYKFYEVNDSNIKLTPVFLGGKGRYKDRTRVNDVNKKIKQYSSVSSNNKSVVIYVFDTDDYDVNVQDQKFMEEVKKYCEKNKYDIIWFCKDVEQVFLGRKVSNDKKRDESDAFKRKKLIHNIKEEKLRVDILKKNSSNILNVLDEYL